MGCGAVGYVVVLEYCLEDGIIPKTIGYYIVDKGSSSGIEKCSIDKFCLELGLRLMWRNCCLNCSDISEKTISRLLRCIFSRYSYESDMGTCFEAE